MGKIYSPMYSRDFQEALGEDNDNDTGIKYIHEMSQHQH